MAKKEKLVQQDNNEMQMIEAGNDAEKLLQDTVFSQTINGLVEGTWQAFAASGPDETAVRERTYAHYRALVDIIHTLQQRVAVRDGIIAKNDGEAVNDNSLGDE